MTISRRNLRTCDLAEAIQRVNVDKVPLPAVIRAAYTRQERADWRFVTARCVFTAEREERQEIYRNHAFLSKPLSGSFEAFLKVIESDGYEVSAQLPPIKMSTQNPNWTEGIVPSDSTGTGFPVRRFSASIDSSAFFIESQLIAYGMPFHASAAQYLNRFLGFEVGRGSRDVGKGELSLDVDDRRGAIELVSGRLSIKRRASDLSLVGQINDEPPLCLSTNDSVVVSAGAIKRVELWLVTKDNEIVDFRSSTEWPHRYESAVAGTELGDGLKQLIRGGESETCEFKIYLDLSDTNQAHEIEKTVCAFSNVKGGTLFIGVDDEGEVLGLEKDLSKAYKRSVDEASGLYVNGIRARLREGLKDNQCFDVQAARLYDQSIIVIRVGRSSEVNYLLNSGQAYIRKGATSRKMSPEDIRAQVQAGRLWNRELE